MKKLLIFLLIATLLCVAGCGGSKNPSDNEANNETEAGTISETGKETSPEADTESSADETEKTPSSEEEIMRFNVTEHGVVPNDASKSAQNNQKINELLAKASKNAVIFFPEGDYYIDASFYGCILLGNVENVTFEGDGATLINSSYDPSSKTTMEAGKSIMFNVQGCRNITFKNLALDYAAYVQVCGKVVSQSGNRTTIKIDERYINGHGKTPLTGNEYVVAVNAIDPDGNVVGDYYAPEAGYSASLSGDMYSVEGKFGSEGDTLVVRFSLGNIASPTIFAVSASNLKFENVRSYSCPSATFYATLDNENFSFDGFHVAPPDGAEWIWGSNADSIHIKGLRGTVSVKNCTFKGLGDDALNVHCIAPTVKSVKGDTVYIDYRYGGEVDAIWSRKGDTIQFYDNTFKLLATGTVKDTDKGTLTLENVSGSIPAGCFAFNKSASPHLEIENAIVDGGRARAFLIQAGTATVKNCSISNLGLAAIIVSPDLDYWGEMGPSEHIEMSGLNVKNVCTMANPACLGAILVTNSHSGSVKGSGILHGTVKVTDSTFEDANAPALYAILVRDLEFTGNTLTGTTKEAYYSGCETVNVK